MRLVLLTAVSISISYYGLTKQDKHRESQQRIQIGFDILFDDYQNRIEAYRTKVNDFLQASGFNLTWVLEQYLEEKEQLRSSKFVVTYLTRLAGELEGLGYQISADRLMIYASDKRLLAAYYLGENQEVVTGVYAASSTGANSFLPTNDPSQSITSFLLNDREIPAPLCPLNSRRGMPPLRCPSRFT